MEAQKVAISDMGKNIKGTDFKRVSGIDRSHVKSGTLTNLPREMSQTQTQEPETQSGDKSQRCQSDSHWHTGQDLDDRTNYEPHDRKNGQ